MKGPNAGELKAIGRKLLSLGAAIDPRVALASLGFDALVDIYASIKKAETLLEQVMAETSANAPETAQAVIAHFASRSDAWDASRAAHPGKDVVADAYADVPGGVKPAGDGESVTGPQAQGALSGQGGGIAPAPVVASPSPVASPGASAAPASPGSNQGSKTGAGSGSTGTGGG